MVSIAPIIEEVTIKSLPWMRFFEGVADILSPLNQDAGVFKEDFTDLTTTGIVNITSNFSRNGKILHFDLLIAPAIGTSSSVLDVTFFKLPELLAFKGNSAKITAVGYGVVSAFDIDSLTDLGNGYVDINTLNVYTPNWGVTGNKIALNGWVRIEGT